MNDMDGFSGIDEIKMREGLFLLVQLKIAYDDCDAFKKDFIQSDIRECIDDIVTYLDEITGIPLPREGN